MKKQLKLNLGVHNITVVTRTDEDNYPEGMTVAQSVEMGIGRILWLQPGITYNEHILDDQGTIGIPKVSAAGGAVTDICAEGDAGTAEETRVLLNINKKYSGKFDGCFTVAGIADKTSQKALNKAKLRAMANIFTKHVEAEMVAGSTESELDPVDPKFKDNPRRYLVNAKNEAYKLAKKMPQIALVSLDFYEELDNAKAIRETIAGDEQYVNGVVGRTGGLLIIPTEIEVDFILYSFEDLNIAKPSNPKQIAAGILGDIESIEGFSFDKGFASFLDVNASVGSAHTWMHGYFGTLITDKTLMLKSKVRV